MLKTLFDIVKSTGLVGGGVDKANVFKIRKYNFSVCYQYNFVDLGCFVTPLLLSENIYMYIVYTYPYRVVFCLTNQIRLVVCVLCIVYVFYSI